MQTSSGKSSNREECYAAASALRALGCKNIVMTLGGDGVRFYPLEGDEIFVPGVKV